MNFHFFILHKGTILFLGLVFATLLSCNTSSTQTDQTGQESTPVAAGHHDEHQIQPPTPVVQLNQGERWQANPETTAGIMTMQRHVEEHISGSTPEDYRALQQKLNSQLQLIFQQCTMTGEAHNQLHNYLLPLKKMIDELDTKDPEAGKEISAHLQSYLAAYARFFV